MSKTPTLSVIDGTPETQVKPRAKKNPPPQIRPLIWRLPSLEAATGLGKTTIYSLISKGQFPQPVQLGTSNARGWLVSEIEVWVEEQRSAREAQRAAS